MGCVRARPSLAAEWRHTNRGRACEVCSCPYLFQGRSLREPWMREEWGAPSPDKPLKHSESRWGRERGRSIPFSDISGRFLLRCTGLACYAYRDLWPWGEPHEAARFQQLAWWRTALTGDPRGC